MRELLRYWLQDFFEEQWTEGKYFEALKKSELYSAIIELEIDLKAILVAFKLSQHFSAEVKQILLCNALCGEEDKSYAFLQMKQAEFNEDIDRMRDT